MRHTGEEARKTGREMYVLVRRFQQQGFRRVPPESVLDSPLPADSSLPLLPTPPSLASLIRQEVCTAAILGLGSDLVSPPSVSQASPFSTRHFAALDSAIAGELRQYASRRMDDVFSAVCDAPPPPDHLPLEDQTSVLRIRQALLGMTAGQALLEALPPPLDGSLRALQAAGRPQRIRAAFSGEAE